MKQHLRDLGTAFGIKVMALIVLGVFFSTYKKWYPKPQSLNRETLYQPIALAPSSTLASSPSSTTPLAPESSHGN